MSLSVEEAAAIERFVLNSTVPLIYNREDAAVLAGSGTLFSVGGQFFVVTARHIFEEKGFDLERVAFPETPIKSGLFTYGSFDFVKPNDKKYDIALFALKCEETIARLRVGWQFLTPKNVAQPSPQGHFFLSGYPCQGTENVNGWLRGRFATAYTERIPHIPENAEKPVDPALDLFFNYAREAEALDGKPIGTPELPGTSGASVWERKEITTGLWSPGDAVKVIGVQSSYAHSEYFRAKSWWSVAQALKELDSALSEELAHALRPDT